MYESACVVSMGKVSFLCWQKFRVVLNPKGSGEKREKDNFQLYMRATDDDKKTKQHMGKHLSYILFFLVFFSGKGFLIRLSCLTTIVLIITVYKVICFVFVGGKPRGKPCYNLSLLSKTLTTTKSD